MEMSPEYAMETARVMSERGYTLEIEENERIDDDVLRFKGVYYRLGADQQKLVLEVIHYPDQEVRYFLEIAEYYGLSSFSFELDSWKHREEHVEWLRGCRSTLTFGNHTLIHCGNYCLCSILDFKLFKQ